MKKHHLPCIWPIVWLALFVIAFTGCVHYQGEGSVGMIIATSEAFKAFDGEYENTPYFKDHKPESIAVLPFSALEEKLFALKNSFDRPEEVIRKGLYNHISSLPFKDLELLDIDTRLLNAGIRSTEMLHALIAENPRKLKSLLGVDAVITGDVTHFDKYYAGVYSQIAVGCEVKLWDLDSGHLLWRARHVSRAHAGGISLNPIGLLMSAAASAWNLRNTEMLSQTDELFREIVSTIELPSSLQLSPKSKSVIDLFTVLNAEKPFTAGKDILFRLIGDRDCRAYVDLLNYRSAIDLKALSPSVKQAMKSEIMALVQRRHQEAGREPSPEMMAELEKEFSSREIYEGAYTVSPEDERYGLTAKAYLVNAFGDQVSRLDVVHTIDIDAKPPAAAAQPVFEALDQKVHLHWPPNREADLAGYEIWTSASPLSGYRRVAGSEKNDIVLEGLINFDPVYIKIRAVDRADNQGPFGGAVEAVSLPRQGLYDLPQPGPVLEGSISNSILLIRGKSPYQISADLRLKPGATLYAEPGVVIRFAPQTALVVEGGGFVAYGRKDLPVILTPAAFKAMPGSWRGLIVNHSEHTLLRHVLIERAETGLSIANSSPEIFSTTIRECSQAGIYLKENARPHITCSVFSSNGGQGGMVIEGAGIAPRIRNNLFIDNHPFAVQSYTPLHIDLTGNYWGAPVPDENLFLGHVILSPFLSAPPKACPDS